MIRSRQIWSILDKHMPRKRWVPAKDIYALVESHLHLNAADRSPVAPLHKTPQWKVAVRDALLEWLKDGTIRSRSRDRR